MWTEYITNSIYHRIYHQFHFALFYFGHDNISYVIYSLFTLGLLTCHWRNNMGNQMIVPIETNMILWVIVTGTKL